MLLAIREKIMGFLGWVILGLIFVTFAFFGLESYLQSSNQTYAARVNDVEISLGQLDKAYSNLNAQMRQRLGKNYDPDAIDESKVRSAALQQLVDGELLSQTTEAAGFSASEAAIAAYINDIDVFKEDGAFSKEKYNRVLGFQGMSPGYFEWEISRELRGNQLQSGITRTAIATSRDLSRAYSLESQQRRFDTIVIPAASVAADVTVSDDEITAHYEANAGRYRTNEQASVQYIELNAATLDLPAGFTDEQLQAEYDANAEKYVNPEQRHARHILIAAPQEKDAIVEAAIKADEIYERLQNGGDFAAVAGEVSDDPATAASGGDLGFFSRGLMTDKFDDAVFAMQVGEISEPVQTDFGFHIIELLEVRPEEASPLADVRDELVASLQKADRENRYYELYDQLANLSYEQPDNLQAAADATGLQLQQSELLTRDGGPGIGENPAVVAAVFSDDVLVNGNNSELIEIGEDHVVVLRILEHVESQAIPLEVVRDNVIADVRQAKIRNLLEQRAAEYMDALRSGELDFDKVAGMAGSEVTVNPLLARNAVSPERVVLDKAFSIRAPRDGGTEYTGLFDAAGDYVLLALHEVRDGVLETLPEAQRRIIGRGLSQIIGMGEMQLVRDMIKADADVVIPAADEDGI